MTTKTYWFKADHTDATTGLVWRAGLVDRVTDEPLQGRLEDATGPAGQKVVIDVGANFVETGDFNSWPLDPAILGFLGRDMDAGQAEGLADDLSAVRYVAQSLTGGQQEQARENIGAGLVGGPAFTANNRYSFLQGSQIGHNFGAIADDAAASINLGTQNSGILIGFHGSLTSETGWLGGRASASSTGLVVLTSTTGQDINALTGPLTGTTGPDNALNFSLDGSTFYAENRSGGNRNISIIVMRVPT